MNTREYVEKAVKAFFPNESKAKQESLSNNIERKLKGINIPQEYKLIMAKTSNLSAKRRILVKDVYEYATKK